MFFLDRILTHMQEFGSILMSIERKYIWTVRVVNEGYVYCCSLK